MNDFISKIDSSKFSLSNFYLISFGGVLNFTHFGESFIFELIVKHLFTLINTFKI